MPWNEIDRANYGRLFVRYPSDLTNEEWNNLRPMIEGLFGKSSKRGRPRKVDIREVLNAILYVMHEGVQWRALPDCFPNYNTVYSYFKKLRKAGPAHVMVRLAMKVRMAEGREYMPSCAVIDTQSAPTYLVGGAKGYDAGKKVKGRKRIVIVDAALGLPLVLDVVPADVQDRDLAEHAIDELGENLLVALRELGFDSSEDHSTVFEAAGSADDGVGSSRRVRKILADGGFKGKKQEAVRNDKGQPVMEFRELDGNGKTLGFVPIANRWKVERTIGWLTNRRNFSKDYSYSLESSKAWLTLSGIITLNRKLTRANSASTA